MSSRIISSLSQSTVSNAGNKRFYLEESKTMPNKKIKRSVDITLHWKKIYATCQTTKTKTFECKAKNNCKINFYHQ